MNAHRMGAIREIVFFLGLGSLFTHELDAIPNHEWRGMPLLGALPDATAMLVFIAGHVPFFAVLIALIASRRERIRRLSRLAISAFLVVHALMHVLSASAPTYEFTSRLSHILIFGSAALGALYLVLSFKRDALTPGK